MLCYFKANLSHNLHHLRNTGHSVRRLSTIDSWAVPDNSRNTVANGLPRTEKKITEPKHQSRLYLQRLLGCRKVRVKIHSALEQVSKSSLNTPLQTLCL